MSTGAELIAAERRRQIEVEHYTAEHDAQHHPEELARAGACYATGYIDGWPWHPAYFRPGDDRVRALVKAGALIAAAIDRLAATTGEAGQ